MVRERAPGATRYTERSVNRTLALFLCVPALAVALTPDRSPLPDEWGYRPADGSTVALNPPSLTWVHENGAVRYTVSWSRRADFSDAVTVSELPWTVYTHNRPLDPGKYFWRYRITGKQGENSAWSRTRTFTIPAGATVFPEPDMADMRQRIGSVHPRLFVRPEDRAKLSAWAADGGSEAWGRLKKEADRLLDGKMIPEPAVKASGSDPETVQYWWPNRTQTEKACMEAEALAFVYWLTGEEKYGAAARRYVLHLASWDPDGPTNWRLNDEAAMPILFRLARVYDWSYAALSEEDRATVRTAMRRRGSDAWKGSQIGQGVGHLNRPYNSHGNRAWHKLGEVAIAGLGDIPEAEIWLQYALDKFWAAYPVWSDDDGGWHEGPAYWSSYNTKVTWWLDVIRRYGIDGFKKPYFAHAADYLMYTAPPGSPDMGFGDLSYPKPSSGMAVVQYYARRVKNPYWAWWAARWGMNSDAGEPVLAFLRSADAVEPKAPVDLPASKVFRGTGLAILNSNLLDSADNVQLRFKSSPFGRQSHGHDPHNSFTLNAYGEQLLVNNVYRDLYGSPFHVKWCWETKSQNALLVDGAGQKVHSPDPPGRISHFELQDGLDWVTGDASAAYGEKLRKYLRHVIFVKPDVVLLVDEVEAAQPAALQWMLHAQAPFTLEGQQLRVERQKGGVFVDYIASEPLTLRQWDGYDPPPGSGKAANVARQFPNQWHVEAASKTPAREAFTVTVLRPYRKGQAPADKIQPARSGEGLRLTIPGASGSVEVALRSPGEFAVVRKGARTWRLKEAQP
jgi:hypothetical protein